MLQRDFVIASAVKQPAMVALLDKPEGLNLIKRTPTPQDRRAALVALTARGRKIAELGGRALLGMNAVALEALLHRRGAADRCADAPVDCEHGASRPGHVISRLISAARVTAMPRRILITGASIAGNTVAWTPAHRGFDVTVVERATRFRHGGRRSP